MLVDSAGLKGWNIRMYNTSCVYVCVHVCACMCACVCVRAHATYIHTSNNVTLVIIFPISNI